MRRLNLSEVEMAKNEDKASCLLMSPFPTALCCLRGKNEKTHGCVTLKNHDIVPSPVRGFCLVAVAVWLSELPRAPYSIGSLTAWLAEVTVSRCAESWRATVWGSLLLYYYSKSQRVAAISSLVLEWKDPWRSSSAWSRNAVTFNINGQETFVIVSHWKLGWFVTSAKQTNTQRIRNKYAVCCKISKKRKVLCMYKTLLAFLRLFKGHNTGWFLPYVINILQSLG